jgi:hypothetical protein
MEEFAATKANKRARHRQPAPEIVPQISKKSHKKEGADSSSVIEK